MMRILYSAAALLTASVTFAQTLQQAITKTDNERFEAAAADFRVLIAREPDKGEHYFYFGENYFRNGEIDSAAMMYNKGVETNATNGLNYVGLGKVLLSKGNEAEAKTQFYKAISIAANKSAEVYRRIAEAWLVTDIRNADEAMAMAGKAIKLEPKNPENYILLGDAQLEKNPTDGSAPVKSYQKATSLDAKSPKGILREGKLYQRGRNYPLALEYYKKAIELNPMFAPAYREVAELYYLAGQPANSIANWKKYLELNDSEHARYRFMSALFSNKQYAEAVAEYEALKKNSKFSSVYLERLAAYSYAEMGDKQDTMANHKGLAAINRFFEMAGPDFKYIPNDYKYKGLLLMRSGKDSLGYIELEKAIALDSSAAGEIYGEMAKAAVKSRDYQTAIGYFDKKRKNDWKNLSNNDRFDLGKANYFLGQNKQKEANDIKAELKKKKKPQNTPEVIALESEATQLFTQADTAFKMLTQLNPEWPVGYLWRGRANSLLDPEAVGDSTKAQYEKMLSLIKPEEKASYKNYQVEAYSYLGYYYVRRKDPVKAKENWEKVKELDPDNEKAKFYLNPPKQPAGQVK